MKSSWSPTIKVGCPTVKKSRSHGGLPRDLLSNLGAGHFAGCERVISYGDDVQIKLPHDLSRKSEELVGRRVKLNRDLRHKWLFN
jgi:hypothetical protein